MLHHRRNVAQIASGHKQLTSKWYTRFIHEISKKFVKHAKSIFVSHRRLITKDDICFTNDRTTFG